MSVQQGREVAGCQPAPVWLWATSAKAVTSMPRSGRLGSQDTRRFALQAGVAAGAEHPQPEEGAYWAPSKKSVRHLLLEQCLLCW